jgi:hypothetical protein
MTKTITALALAIVTLTGASAAIAETKAPRPKTCDKFSEATTSDGHKIGICAASKPGGKPTYLSRYTIVEIKADDGVTTRVMIGFR